MAPTRTPASRSTTTTPKAAVPAGATTVRTPAWWRTLLLGGLLLGVTLYGLVVPGAYRVPEGVRPTLSEVLRGQDLVTLLAAVGLIWGAFRARAGSFRGHVVWLAVCLYAAYTYLMYVVAPYNDAFLAYVAIIGLAGYGLFDGLVRIDVRAIGGAFDAAPRRSIAWFLIVTGTMFAAVWLIQILSVFPGGIPDGLFAYDIPSTVHVLDLAFVLPLVIASGILLLREHPIAPVLAALVLVKTVTLGLALVSMNLFVLASGEPLDVGETVVWSVVALVSAGLVLLGSRRMGQVQGAWLRPTIW